jgi:RNA polymerase sigma factor (sigma-70 family)
MSHSPNSAQRLRRKSCAVAMVLGTALSAFGTATAGAAVPARAVSDITRYCSACWRNARLHPDCWSDCTQEVFCRLLERVTPEGWNQALAFESEERRELVRAIDAVKKRTQRSRKGFSAAVETLADEKDPSRRLLADDRAAVRQVAAALLSPRQQRILDLSFSGWSVQDIAAELRLPAARVSDEKYKAIQRLRDHFEAVSGPQSAIS